MKAIVHTKLLLEDGIIWDGAVTWENDTIIDFGRVSEVAVPRGAEVVDAGGLYTAPGLIDIHNHGGPEHLFFEDPIACSEHFLRHGETTVLPTFYCDLTLEQMLAGAERLRRASHSGAGRIIGGVYMEGPYMSGFGSNQKAILWNGEIVREEYMPLIEKMAGFARIWAIDPARNGIETFLRDVRAADPKAIFAMGHSCATAEQCRKLRKYGLFLQTHHGDSGKAKGRAQGTIGAGCDEYTLYNPEVFAEMVCDENGVHLDPDMVRMVLRTKGVERVVLITDSMPDKYHFKNNEADGVYYGPDLNYDEEGHLAGSHLTLDAACRNLMAHTGCGICQAIRMASLNPAKVLCIDGEVGSIEVGKKANLILIDDMVRVQAVVFEGERQNG